MMFLCMKLNMTQEFIKKFKLISYEELDNVLYPCFFCDDVSLIQNFIDDGTCILYEIMTFKGGE